MSHDPTPSTRDELLAQLDAGRSFEYLPFWGHRASRKGALSKSCLSQWWPAPFEVDGLRYATAEHWMMAGKARLFGDSEHLAKILATPTPNDAKRLGRRVRDFDPTIWEAERFEIVVAGSIHKFGQNARLGSFLAATAPRILVEASPMDRIWGIGLSASSPEATDPKAWRGQNLLGFALTVARERLSTLDADQTRETSR